MKRLFLSLAVAAITAGSAFAQTSDPAKLINDAKSKIQKSDADIQDAKKNVLSKTWEARGKMFLDAAKVNTKGVNQGMYAAKCDQSPFFNLEIVMGQPTEKKNNGEYEVWVYPTINFYIQNNQVQIWKETVVADEKALDKSVEAYRKADELDAKGGFKNKKTTIDAAKDLRLTYFTNGINAYQLKNYNEAAQNFEGAYALADFPRDAKDTTLNDGQIAYYAALSYFQGENKAKAMKLFQESCSKNYQVGSAIHYIYQIYMDDKKDAEALKVITEAYEKYPQEEQILYDVINYYLGKQQTSEAEKYLDKAIEKYPSNVNLLIVKSSMYITEYGNLAKKYTAELNKVDSLRKLAFRNRSNAAEEKRLTAEKDAMQSQADATRAKYVENQNKAKENYNKVIAKDSKNYDAYYGLGFVEYDMADLVSAEKNVIPLSEDKDGSKAAAKEAEIKKCLEKSAENFEKASAIRPTQADVLKNLKTLYYKLGNTAKWNEVKEKLEKL